MGDLINLDEARPSRSEKRRHGDPLFEENVQHRSSIRSRGTLRLLSAVRNDDSKAADDAERSFQVQAVDSLNEPVVDSVREFARPALHLIAEIEEPAIPTEVNQVIAHDNVAFLSDARDLVEEAMQPQPGQTGHYVPDHQREGLEPLQPQNYATFTEAIQTDPDSALNAKLERMGWGRAA